MASQNSREPAIRAQLAWLGCALLVHGGLLLLPFGGWTEKPRVQPRLNIQLVDRLIRPYTGDTTPLPAPETAEPPPVETDPLVQPEPGQPGAIADSKGNEKQAESPEAETNPPGPPERLTAAILMHSASKQAVPRPDSAPAYRLGVHTPRDLPANWGRRMDNESLLSRSPGMAVPMSPAQPVIVDRWLDASGDHNVVVTLPNGDTVCGRAQAWDPMQPLVEHIMMFRTCGSGGKRTFDMASRPTPRWATAE